MYSTTKLPRKRMRDYFMPFFIIVIIIAIVIFGWKTLNQFFITNSLETTNERVFLSIENGSVKAMMENKNEWKNAPDNIYLYRGEKLRTGADGRASLTFADQSIMRLEKNSEVGFTQLKKNKDSNLIEVALNEGQIWTKIEKVTNPDSGFTITTDMLTVDSKGGIIAVDYPGTVYVIDGTAQVGVKYDGEVIKTINVGVGQQFMVDADGVNNINEGIETTLIFAMSDSFKSSGWYRWNMKKDGAISAFEETETGTGDETSAESAAVTGDETSAEDIAKETVLLDGLVSVTKPSAGSVTNKSSISLEGLFDPDKVGAVYIEGKKASVTDTNKWKVSAITLAKEGENKLSVEAEDSTGVRQTLDPFVITYDGIAPDVPVIEEPGANDEKVTIKDIEQIIKGSVSSDTYAVIVNDYKLGKYVPGSKEWQYYAKTAYGNLEVGENEYKVIAEDKAGNQSEPAVITLTLEQETVDAAKEETAGGTGSAESLPESTSEGGVTITGPNGGKSFTTSETAFEIKGEVPANTAKVMVNDYQLTKFTEGDTTFTYKASSAMDNLEIGEKNTYTAKAYDTDDKLIGSASITIDVQSGSASAPAITMPSSSGTYTTTLNEIVLGGTVGKWIQKLYVNDELLSSYIPGSEKWSKSVKLTAGENTFAVYGEQDSEKTASASITISYTP